MKNLIKGADRKKLLDKYIAILTDADHKKLLDKYIAILTEGFKSLFNTEMGYRVIEYPYEYEGKRYIGYVLVKPYRMFGIYGYDRVTHFTDINSLNVFIGDDLIIDSYGWIKCKINLVA